MRRAADAGDRTAAFVEADRPSDTLSAQALTAHGDALTVKVRGHGHAVDAEPGSEFVNGCPGQVFIDERRDLAL